MIKKKDINIRLNKNKKIFASIIFLIFLYFLMSLFSFTNGVNFYISNSQNYDNNLSYLSNVTTLNLFVKVKLNSSDLNRLNVTNDTRKINISFILNSENESYNVTKSLNVINGTNQTEFENDFLVSDIFTDVNLNEVKSGILNINLLNKNYTLFVDNSKPKIDILKSNIDKINKKLNLEINLYDNYFLKNFSLYTIENGEKTLIKNVSFTNKTKNKTININVNLVKKGYLSLIFTSYDEAKNNETLIKLITIPDIFPPTLNNVFIYKSLDGLIHISFNASDDTNIAYFSLESNTQKLENIVNKSSISESILVPFKTDILSLRLVDNSNNYRLITFNLENPFYITYFKKYNNKPEIELLLNKDISSCYVKKINEKDVNINMIKDKNKFTANLNLNNEEGYYNILVFCKSSMIGKYFKKTFIYETSKPKNVTLKSTNLYDGSIKLKWTKSYDNLTNVTYKLFRNGKIIYSGKGLSYNDKSVIYPNKYTYVLKVYNDAGNYIDSNKIEIVPFKTAISFKTNLLNINFVKNNSLNLTFFSDKFLDIKLIVTNVKNNFKKIIFNDTFSNLNKTNYYKIINLMSGKNIINISAKNKYDKKISISKIVYLNETEKSKIKSKNETKPINVITKPTKKNQNLSNVTKKSNIILNGNNNNNFNLIWFLLIIFILIVIAFYLGKPFKFNIFRDNEIKRKRVIRKKNKDNIFKRNDFIKKIKDKHLEEELKKVRENRTTKKIENLMNKNKKKRSLTDFEKQKLEELKLERERKNILSNINKRRLPKTKVKRYRKMNFTNFINNFKEYLRERKEEKIKRKEEERRLQKIKEEKAKIDMELYGYINKVRSGGSWNSTKDYLLSTKLEKERKKLEKEKAKLEELKQKEEEQRKKFEEKEKEKLKKMKLEEEKRRIAEEKKRAREEFENYLKEKSKKRKFLFFK